ncbi:ATP-binding cassette domain-containing protein [Rhodobacteraceae bacterium]|nr:ATP-binding cassette domain-containing protein [Paracoccaceae bacterium]
MKLHMQNLTKSYHSGHPVLNVPDGTLGEHGLEGLIGPNGAGKSTMMGLLTRRIAPSTGTVSLEDDTDLHTLNALQSHDVARLGLVKTNQRIQGFESLTIRDSLRLAATSHADETYRGVLTGSEQDDAIEADIDGYLDRFKFEDPDGFAKSGGEKKLLDILRCMIFKPKMLLMDEPTAGLPEDVTNEVMKMVGEKVKSKEMTVVIVEHDLELIWKHCKYVHFLSEGAILFHGTPKDVKKNRVVAEKYMGV